jgi:uroporphyrin-III C-methyltransferase/precorrin-2 dehydrogenase/sirohydrochlorin ferrochelatase
MSPPRHEAEPLFPLFLDLAGQRALVVGGTAEAAAKAELLCQSGACVTVAAAALDPRMTALVLSGAVEHVARFEAALLDGARICIAHGDEAKTRVAAEAARARGVLFNAVDRPALCDFIVPAVVDRGPVRIAISTGGAAPLLAARIRALVEDAVPASIGAVAALCGRWRDRVAAAVPAALRRRFWDAVLDGPEAEAALAGKAADADRLVSERLARGIRAGGSVALVGAGPGDPELLTRRAASLIRRADVILYDKLVGGEVLALARRDARRIDVGKRCGRHEMSQAAINRLLAEHAARGSRVVRLKGGDPFVFGRGGEELEWLRRAGVPVEIIPGITAAVAVSARLGIPLTHRGVARSLYFVTGHGREGEEYDIDAERLAGGDATLACYMGARRAATLSERLIDAGLPPSTPAVAVENATRPEERVIVGTLSDLPARLAAAALTGPTLILIGTVISLRAALPDTPGARAVG